MGLYDLSLDAEFELILDELNKMYEKNAVVELKKKHPPRSNKQNNYLHALICLWGIRWGYSIDEAKTTIKRDTGYKYQKNGKWFLEKTSKMDTKQLTIFIETFRNWSAKNGYYLWDADEYKVRQYEISREIEKHREHLY